MWKIIKKKGFPSINDTVIVKIININPHSAFASLEEYDNRAGMIHISEVSNGWVRDIRRYVRSDEITVARIMNVDESNGHISLSLKRVSDRQKREKMMEQRMEQRAEKMLEIAAKSIGKTHAEAMRDVGYKLIEDFDSLFNAFQKSVKDADALKMTGVPDEWVNAIKTVAEKSIQQKEFLFNVHLNVRSNEPDGIYAVRKTLLEAEKLGLNVSYISSPVYLARFKTTEGKKGEKLLTDKLNNLVSFGKSVRTNVSYEIAH